jgi:hypothetical protein
VNFWSWALKFLQESDLVLIPSNPRSFYHPMIFTHLIIVPKISEIFYPKIISLWYHFWIKHLGNFRNYDQRGYQKSSDDKNSSDLKELERDPTPVKISAPNSKNSRSYSIFCKSGQKIRFSGSNKVTRSLRTESFIRTYLDQNNSFIRCVFVSWEFFLIPLLLFWWSQGSQMYLKTLHIMQDVERFIKFLHLMGFEPNLGLPRRHQKWQEGY